MTQAARLRRACAIALGATGTLLLLAWVWFLIAGRHLSRSAASQLFSGFDLAEQSFGPSSDAAVPHIVFRILVFLTVLVLGAALVYRFRDRVAAPAVTWRVFSFCIGAGCCCVLCHNLFERTIQAPWYNIEMMMTNSALVPVFGQRLLLIWPAMLLKHVFSRLTYIQAFCVVQAFAIVLSVYVFGIWSSLFIGKKLALLGQVFLTLLLIPTMLHFQAHDIGVVLTYTLCFVCLYRRQYVWFIAAFFIGIFNHQNILLLIPTAGCIMYGKERTGAILRVLAACTVIYLSTRFFLNHAIPIPQNREDKLWWNMRQIAELHRTMIFGFMLTVPWYGAAIAIFQYADSFLKRASVLFPMQLAIYIVYGQLNEARLFNGFLPILIGIYLCFIRSRFFDRDPALPALGHTIDT